MNAPAIDPEQYRATIDSLGLIPRADVLDRFVRKLDADGKYTNIRFDDSVAPIMVEALRYNYSRVYEEQYAELKAAMGMVCPIDSSPSPADDSYKYDVIDVGGYVDWIGDDGTIMSEGFATMRSHLGFMAEAGGKISYTVFDLERAAASGRQLEPMRMRAERRKHEAKHNWVWLFGDPEKQLHGLFTHPNIQVVLAPLASTAVHSDQRDRLIQNKTLDEILADIETIVETPYLTTKGAVRVRKVFMSPADMSTLRRRRDGTGTQSVTFLSIIQAMYPNVEFDELFECDPDNRLNPKTGINDSGLSGQCWIAVPDLPADECGFVMARPFTQRAPQEVDLKITSITHSKIGGFKCLQPLGVVRMDFVAPDNNTATP